MTMKPLAAAALLGGLLAGTGAASAALEHAPVDDAAPTARDVPVAIDVLANDPGVSPQTILQVWLQPGHGSARVVNRRVVYTPAPGFTGRDQLRYLVKTGRSFGTATVSIDVGDPLRLQGRVGEGGSGAAVSARVGGHRFHAKADAQGAYAIDVIGLDADMVRLESRRGEVALASIVGGFERLRAEAGADGVLGGDENNQVQLTRLSAAHAYLLQLANNGAPVDSEERLAAAQGAMDVDVLLEMAAAIKLVADGTHALPEGAGDTMALISDTEAYQQFVAGVEADAPGALDAAIAATLSDADVLPPTDAAAMAGARWLVPGGADGSIRVGLVAGQHLVLSEAGTGSYVDTVAVADTGAAWSLVDGAAQVILEEPRRQEYPGYEDGEPVRMVYSTGRLDITRLVDGGASGRDLVGIVGHVVVSYPDNPEYPETTHTSVRSMLSYRDDVAGIPFRAEEFPAVRALQLHRPGNVHADNPSGYALHRFHADGSGLVLDDGQAFTWTLHGNGRLQLAYDDGEVVRFTRLMQDGAKGDGVIATFQLPDGSARTFYAQSSVQDGSLAFDIEALARPWRSGFDISQPAYDAGYLRGFYIVLDGPGQTGQQLSVRDDLTTTADPLSWELVDGAMVASRYRDLNGWQAECTVGVNGCRVFSERRWTPVSRAGNRIYVLEELWMAESLEPSPLNLISQRANFYQVQAPPPH